ncbi:nucleotide-binding universal stress UspA family protein [Sphingobium sp. B7D2B]|uniref:hypothetical protein n=1 Tax=Sphingobium sp. B7D2B TaxID=2940583 RepID=UPI002224229F|nr:hypothetical protein [Sphingobium sp. B7D2B]MCW2365536.1 nucleotide-binding universal stress UspA family protein [Sphingobium sp. B7D2B]
MSEYPQVPEETIRNRVANGWSEERAANTPINAHRHREDAPNVAQLAREAGVRPSAVQQLVREGYPIGAAIIKAQDRKR